MSIGCDGRYNIQLDNGRIVRGWDESKVRLHQATITRTEDVYDDVYVPDQRQHAAYDHGYTHSSSADDMMGGSVPGIALVVLVLLVVALVLSGACNQRITEGAVIALFMQTPGHRLQRFALQAHFSSALARDEKNNSQDEQAKLDDIVRHVSERAMIQGGEVFLLRQDIILRENRKQAMEAEAARRRQMADAHGANRGGSTGPMAGRGGQVVRQRVGTRVVADEVSTERARAARENVLAAQAKLRVAAVKAKQDAAESARVREFQTKMDQLNRELQADTSQLGNAMARYVGAMSATRAYVHPLWLPHLTSPKNKNKKSTSMLHGNRVSSLSGGAHCAVCCTLKFQLSILEFIFILLMPNYVLCWIGCNDVTTIPPQT